MALIVRLCVAKFGVPLGGIRRIDGPVVLTLVRRLFRSFRLCETTGVNDASSSGSMTSSALSFVLADECDESTAAVAAGCAIGSFAFSGLVVVLLAVAVDGFLALASFTSFAGAFSLSLSP